MKRFLAILLLFILSCEKVDTECYDVDGTFVLTALRKNGNTICVYDSSFYYSYELFAGRALVTQYRSGQDSIVRTFTIDCNETFNRTQDSFYYGSPVSYAVLVKVK